MASLADESTQPVLIAVTATAVPAATERSVPARPASWMLARAPSDARSRTQTVPTADASPRPR